MMNNVVNTDVECPHCNVHFNVASGDAIPESCPACGGTIQGIREKVGHGIVDCIDCGYSGKPDIRGGLSVPIFILLLLLGVLPALVYGFLCGNEYYCCPKCGSQRLNWTRGAPGQLSKRRLGCCGIIFLALLFFMIYNMLKKLI